MKNTNLQIQRTFLKLLNTYKIDEIDVNMICKTLSIKRQTFYYHYRSLYDVVVSIYYSKSLKAKRYTDFKKIIEDLGGFLFKDADFNRDIIDSNVKEVLVTYLISFMQKSIVNLLSTYEISKEAKMDIGRFISYGVVNQALYYFKNDEYSLNDIVSKILIYMNDHAIDRILVNYRKQK